MKSIKTPSDQVRGLDSKTLDAAAFKPAFRVVAREQTRRGIRLENYVWSVLRALAERRRSTMGSMVEAMAAAHGEAGNLASVIRVNCMHALAQENARLREVASQASVNRLLTACPSPAFTLSSGKKILHFNEAFQHLVRRQLPPAKSDEAQQELRLVLDLPLPDVFATLAASANKPVLTGFVIGSGERRYRGRVSLVTAPLADQELLIAFVIGG